MPHRLLFTLMNQQSTQSALEEFGIPQVERVKKVWHNFPQDSPGRRSVLVDAVKALLE